MYASVCTRMHLYASVCIYMHPNASKSVVAHPYANIHLCKGNSQSKKSANHRIQLRLGSPKIPKQQIFVFVSSFFLDDFACGLSASAWASLGLATRVRSTEIRSLCYLTSSSSESSRNPFSGIRRVKAMNTFISSKIQKNYAGDIHKR